MIGQFVRAEERGSAPVHCPSGAGDSLAASGACFVAAQVVPGFRRLRGGSQLGLIGDSDAGAVRQAGRI